MARGNEREKARAANLAKAAAKGAGEAEVWSKESDYDTEYF